MRLGDNGKHVKELQYKLRKVLNRNILLDGDFGKITERHVKSFQALNRLTQDGIVGKYTMAVLDKTYEALFLNNSKLLNFGKRRFVVFVDAGHGGIDDKGLSTTSGKRANHPNALLHQDGHYYEGFENRLMTEAFIEACTDAGIMCIRTYHPEKDTSLSQRTELIRSYLRRGYYGYMHSFHSNAIASSNSKEKLEATKGFMVFNTRGDTFSDKIADQHFDNVKSTIGRNNWTFREQNKKDGDADFEVNFQILRETDLREFVWFGAILDEWGFHTSKGDCEFITDPNNRIKRVQACLQTAKWVKKELNAMIKQ